MSAEDSFCFPSDVEGWLNEQEGRLLCEFAARAAAKGDIVVELGSYKGRSTICLAQGTRDLVAVDHGRGTASEGMAGGYLPELLANLERYGTRGHTEVWEADTAECAERLKEMVGFLFIDGDHSACQRDLDAWKRKVRKGGWIGFHDRELPDVRNAIASLNGWRVAGEAGGLVVMESPMAKRKKRKQKKKSKNKQLQPQRVK